MPCMRLSSVPDPKRGEQLVLVTDCDEATRPALQAAAREAGLPEIFVPRVIVKVPSVPLLGDRQDRLRQCDSTGG